MTNQILQQNQIPNEPQLKDVLDLFRKDLLINFNVHHIGTIQSFNAVKQTATVSINYKKTFFQLNTETGNYDPVLVDYPALIDCPVVCLGGGGSLALTFPIAQGDECIVLFNDRDIDNWFVGGGGQGVATGRLHSFADGLVLVGVRSLANVLKNYDTARAVLGSTGGAYVGVGSSLVKIANQTYTLKTVLQNLTTQLNSLTTAIAAITVPVPALGTSGVPLNAASITTIGTNISTIATQIGSLLE